MDYRLESEVWLGVQESMPERHFSAMVGRAVRGYKRLSGHSPLERVHAADVGLIGIAALREALAEIGQLHHEDAPTFVSIRAQLRSHMFDVLRSDLLKRPGASGAVADSRFACDLGL